jgi:broad specificity phosphatase PhoE
MLLALAVAAGLATPPAAAPAEAASPVLQVYLVRHGQAFSNLTPKPKMTDQQLDHLTPLGREQAAETGRALAARAPAAILTSPAGRARETAEEIRQAAGVAAALRVEPRVRPQGESETPEQVAARVLEAVRAARERHRGAVVVVAHSEVIGAFLAVVRGEPAANVSMVTLRNGSVSLVELDSEGRPELVFANQLPDELPPP